MNNLSQTAEALSIKELEARQEALREELCQIQKLIDREAQAQAKIQEAVASITRCRKWLQEFAPHAEQRFIGAILAELNQQTPPLHGNNSSHEDLPQRSAFQKVIDSVGSTVNKMFEPSEDGDSSEDVSNADRAEVSSFADLAKEGEELRKELVALPYVEFVTLTPQVGYLRRTDDGAILGAYLGGKNKSLLEVWGRCICAEIAQNGGKCSYELRTAQRLKDAKYEIKFTGISFSILQSLTELDTAKSPKFRATEKGIADLEKGSSTVQTDLEDQESTSTAPLVLQIGDRVLIKSDRHGEEVVDQVGVVSAASRTGAAINVSGQLQYFHSDEFDVVERCSKPRNPADDLAVSRTVPLDLASDAVPW